MEELRNPDLNRDQDVKTCAGANIQLPLYWLRLLQVAGVCSCTRGFVLCVPRNKCGVNTVKFRRSPLATRVKTCVRSMDPGR